METHGMSFMYMNHWWLWMLVWLIFWVVIIGGVLLLIRTIIVTKTGSQKRSVDILNERYAKGEITKEEYLEKKRDITGSS